MGGMGLIFSPVLVRHLSDPSGLSGPITSTSWTPNYSKQSLWKVYLASDSPPTHPLIHVICDVTGVAKKLLKIQQC